MRLSLSITSYWWPDGPAGLGVRLAGMVGAADAVPAVRGDPTILDHDPKEGVDDARHRPARAWTCLA
jgi:hypothetical protein